MTTSTLASLNLRAAPSPTSKLRFGRPGLRVHATERLVEELLVYTRRVHPGRDLTRRAPPLPPPRPSLSG
jgi:hypothetical protein